MATYSFKSSGNTVQKIASNQQARTAPPIGFKTPLRLGTTTGIFDMHTSPTLQINDNLRNLLLTNRGERLAFNDFGADLRRLTTEFTTDEDFDTAAMDSIKNAVARWMPFIELNDFSSSTNRNEVTNTAIRDVVVTYTIPIINNKLNRLLVRLYVI